MPREADSRLSSDGLLTSIRGILQRNAPEVAPPESLDPQTTAHFRDMYRSYLRYRDPLSDELQRICRAEQRARFADGRFAVVDTREQLEPRRQGEYLSYRRDPATGRFEVVRFAMADLSGTRTLLAEIDALDAALSDQVVSFFRRR